jgi:hypothetical protein
VFSALKHFSYLGLEFDLEEQSSGPITPTNAYVTEDTLSFYVAEDGVTFYVQES